jgi:putative ABC transport system substrate-binding protein
MQFDQLRRREFITLLGGAAVAWPLAARAQETKQVRRIGVLTGDAEDDPGVKARLAAFRQGLDRLGWSLDRNVRIERESRTIPIVFVNVSDPIGSGLVASLAPPGGNLTGLLLYEEGITGKWLAMLKEIAPGLSRAALIANPKRTPYDSSPLVACSIGSARKSGMKSMMRLAYSCGPLTGRVVCGQ